MEKKKYAIVGTSSRSFMYIDSLLGDYGHRGELKALCDINGIRMAYAQKYIAEKYGCSIEGTYKPEEFETMIERHGIECVIVASIDRTHHDYIIRAMKAGCDVVCEKPMTIDEKKAERIIDVQRRTGRNARITFNYRYAPRNTKVKSLLQSGIIGKVKSVHFEWMLNTKHGADYFRRWHRDKRNSGGLMVHKATHHFDLMNWWLDSLPERVFAMGDLVFYGRENAEKRGMTRFYDRGTSEQAEGDPFALNLNEGERFKEMYLKAEGEDAYKRDQNVFSDGISIEDDMSVIVRYRNGAVMTYHLTAYSPWEGYRISFNGDKGRLEYDVVEKAYVSGGDNDPNRVDVQSRPTLDIEEKAHILVRPHWEKPYCVALEAQKEGGHGGGDQRMLQDIFAGSFEGADLDHAADHMQGAYSILTGIAANRSMQTGEAVEIADLLKI